MAHLGSHFPLKSQTPAFVRIIFMFCPSLLQQAPVCRAYALRDMRQAVCCRREEEEGVNVGEGRLKWREGEEGL